MEDEEIMFSVVGVVMLLAGTWGIYLSWGTPLVVYAIMMAAVGAGLTGTMCYTGHTR